MHTTPSIFAERNVDPLSVSELRTSLVFGSESHYLSAQTVLEEKSEKVSNR